MPDSVFELSMLGGALEKRYRRLRPDIEQLPWGTLDPAAFPPDIVARARRFWTLAAFQEHRTAAACAATLEALIAACAPVDLIAVASRFLLDEMAHVELCARLASELGGGTRLLYNPDHLYDRPPPGLSPLLHAADLVLRVFCAGEAFSVPMQRATANASHHPLIKRVIARIAKDEAAHGQFGWTFFDWAAPFLDDESRAHLKRVSASAVATLETMSESEAPGAGDETQSLGWLSRGAYRVLAARVLEEYVREPLRARGLIEG